MTETTKPCRHDLLNCFECEYPEDKPAPVEKAGEVACRCDRGRGSIPDNILHDPSCYAALRAEVAALKEWIRSEGERAQMCTYYALKEPCPTGRCCEKRRQKEESHERH